jgi:hypothetical protein
VTHIFGFERSLLLLLPEAVDDYVGADNPVRFVDAFVSCFLTTQLSLLSPPQHHLGGRLEKYAAIASISASVRLRVMVRISLCARLPV